MADRASAVNEMKALHKVLQEDVKAALSAINERETPYSQRALVRAQFALIEGLAYQMRQVTIATLEGTDLLTQDELDLLKEVRYEEKENGKLEAKPNFLPFRKSLIFTMKCYAKNHGASFAPELKDGGWQAMRDAIDVRHRITHPKSAESLALSGKDMDAFMNAESWWTRTMLALWQAADDADEVWRKRNCAKSGHI